MTWSPIAADIAVVLMYVVPIEEPRECNRQMLTCEACYFTLGADQGEECIICRVGDIYMESHHEERSPSSEN